MERDPAPLHPLLETAEWQSFTPGQRTAIESVLHKARVARDANQAYLETRTMDD
jgi:predicted Fe-S protein YdhL (DUF1289 family)